MMLAAARDIRLIGISSPPGRMSTWPERGIMRCYRHTAVTEAGFRGRPEDDYLDSLWRVPSGDRRAKDQPGLRFPPRGHRDTMIASGTERRVRDSGKRAVELVGELAGRLAYI